MPRAGVSAAARAERRYDEAVEEFSGEDRVRARSHEDRVRARSQEDRARAREYIRAVESSLADEDRRASEDRARRRPREGGDARDESGPMFPHDLASSNGGIPGRRTITIQGRGAERYTPRRRRPERTLHERAHIRPDRAAMWAVLLGVLLVLAAATSSHAAQRGSAHAPAPAAPLTLALR